MGYERKGTQPMKITVQEGKEKAFDEFPGLKQEELDTVNDFYDHYLFCEKSGNGRKLWSSCCHQKGRFLSMTSEREITPAIRDALWGRHGLTITCPFCGKPVELKAKGTAKNCKGLEEYIPVIFLSTADDGETIYAQAYWTNKDYDHNWAAEPLYMATYVYRFRRGEAVQWGTSYYGDTWYKQVSGFFHEPFRSGGGMYLSYDDYQVIGLECLKESFLKYIDFTVCRSKHGVGWWNLMRFLAMAAQYPENVEMLQKAGMTDVLDDWTRELEKALKARNKAQEAQKEAQENLDNMVDELSDAKRERDEAVEAKQAAESSLQTRLEEQEKRISADLEAERAKVQALKTKSDDLQEKLKATRDKEKESKAAAENARQELEDLKKKPVDVAVSEPSQETLDKLREEAAAAAEEKIKEANARLTEAQAKADAAEAEAEKIRKQLELADQSSVAFKFYFEEWQHKYNAMLGALRKVEQSDQIKATKLKTAIQAAAGKMGTMV